MQLKFSLLLLLAPLITASPVAEAQPEGTLEKRVTIKCAGYGSCSGPSPYCCDALAYGACCSNYKRGELGFAMEKRTTIKCPGYGSCSGPSPYCCDVTKWGACCENY